jgi:hypothetical protein
MKTSTREIPFLHTYGIDVIILDKIECPSHRVVHYTLEGKTRPYGQFIFIKKIFINCSNKK